MNQKMEYYIKKIKNFTNEVFSEIENINIETSEMIKRDIMNFFNQNNIDINIEVIEHILAKEMGLVLNHKCHNTNNHIQSFSAKYMISSQNDAITGWASERKILQNNFLNYDSEYILCERIIREKLMINNVDKLKIENINKILVENFKTAKNKAELFCLPKFNEFDYLFSDIQNEIYQNIELEGGNYNSNAKVKVLSNGHSTIEKENNGF